MKRCSVCNAALPTSLDEYGSALVPVCRQCWFKVIECTCENGLVMCGDCIADPDCESCEGSSFHHCNHCKGTGTIHISTVERDTLDKLKWEYEALGLGELAS